MHFGENARAAGRNLKALALAAMLTFGAGQAAATAPAASGSAAAPIVAGPAVASATSAPLPAAPGAQPATVTAAPAVVAAPVLTPAEVARSVIAPGGYTPMKPTLGKGMPVDGRIGFQDQYSPVGDYALWMHDRLLMPLIVFITLFVLGLLLWVMFRYRKSANPVPSKTSHNTLIEIIWTGLPIIILLVVFVPSMKLLGQQYAPAPAKALTVKATGNQWYWTYSYPDNGGIEVISNMLPDEAAIKNGEPPQLAADLRMVLPAGEPIRLQTTASDVIHAFAVPSLWFKLDAVPGRINEKVLFIKEPGVYYGQCSELCGARHGYMPIVVEALPRDKFNAWVMTQSGGAIDGLPKPVEAPAPAPVPAAPTPAPSTPAASPAPAA